VRIIRLTRSRNGLAFGEDMRLVLMGPAGNALPFFDDFLHIYLAQFLTYRSTLNIGKNGFEQ